MNVSLSLSPDLEQWVQDRVATGPYSSAAEVIREALRLLQTREQFRSDVLAGVAQLDRGEVAKLDMEAIKAAARQKRQK
jgi:antitoxin ParD1/3/4